MGHEVPTSEHSLQLLTPWVWVAQKTQHEVLPGNPYKRGQFGVQACVRTWPG